MQYTAPKNDLLAFHCPYCKVFAQVTWSSLTAMRLASAVGLGTPTNATGLIGGATSVEGIWIARCTACRALSIWRGDEMISPAISHFGPEPSDDMPNDIKIDFNEARSIAGHSPRGAAALIRLCLQKLCKALGEKGDNISDDIAKLVARGLDVGIQQALDAVRVIGNNAVHPGTIDLKDDRETVESLMELVNFVVDAMITQPNKRKALYARIPASTQAAIAKRDGKTP